MECAQNNIFSVLDFILYAFTYHSQWIGNVTLLAFGKRQDKNKCSIDILLPYRLDDLAESERTDKIDMEQHINHHAPNNHRILRWNTELGDFVFWSAFSAINMHPCADKFPQISENCWKVAPAAAYSRKIIDYGFTCIRGWVKIFRIETFFDDF